MIEKDKILKIENAKQSFGMFLMAMEVKFAYSYGDFYILNTHNAENFYTYCKKNGVSETELKSMTITEVENEL